LRDRFGIVQRLEYYAQSDLAHIVNRSASILGIKSEQAGVEAIASRSRGTPRIANRLLRRARDYAEIKGDGVLTGDIAAAALDMLDVDPSGLDTFDGGPVGIDNLAAAIGEEKGTLEDVIEPYLIQQGLIMRTARGRMATRHAWQYFGLNMTSDAKGLKMKVLIKIKVKMLNKLRRDHLI